MPWIEAKDRLPLRLVDSQYYAKIKSFSVDDLYYTVIITPLSGGDDLWTARGIDYSGGIISDKIYKWFDELEPNQEHVWGEMETNMNEENFPIGHVHVLLMKWQEKYILSRK